MKECRFMRKPYLGTLTLALAATLLGACAAPRVGGGDYNAAQVRGEQSVRLGNVMSVRMVRIEGNKSPLGALTGAALGGLAGHTVGQGNGQSAATIAGVVAGGIAGAAIEESATKQDGVEVTVQFDNGKLSVVTQAADEDFRVGDRVMVTTGHGVTRVTKVAAGSQLNQMPPPPGSAPTAVPPVNSAPPAHSAPPPGSAPEPSPAKFRWFCPATQGYYPATPTCTQKWIKVVE
jgi:outer membrane lipoprotein SlyB